VLLDEELAPLVGPLLPLLGEFEGKQRRLGSEGEGVEEEDEGAAQRLDLRVLDTVLPA